MECLVAREPEQSRLGFVVGELTCSMMGGAMDHASNEVALLAADNGQQFLSHHHHHHQGPSSPPELTMAGLSFSKELIAFSLYGKIDPKCKRPWNEELSSKIAEVQQSFKNIPPKLYFSPSSVRFDGIGVYAAEPLPQDTMLGPYYGKPVTHINSKLHNEWLWEVYHSDSSLAHFVDASDPKLGNWMNFIQCARSSCEQNLKMVQYSANIYYIVTRDIAVGDELLVWYDEHQYDVYMGVPTGFRATKGQLFGTAVKIQQTGMPHTSQYYTNHSQLEQKLHQKRNTDIQQHHNTAVVSNTPPPMVTNTTSSTLLDSTSTEDSGFHEHSEGSVATSLTGSFENSNPQTTETGKTVPPHSFSETPLYQQQSTTVRSRSSSLENVTVGQHGTGGFHLEESKSTKWSSSQVAGGVYVAPIGHLHSAEHPTMSSSIWMNGGHHHHTTSSSSSSNSPVPGEQSPASKKQLLYGMFSRSEDGTRWQCEECKRLFSSQGSLRAHARIHTGERPYQCQYCYRTFCQASTLRSHERLHTGEKPYKCEHCGRAFTQSAGLRSHLKTHRYDS